jgi:hypothetical protein
VECGDFFLCNNQGRFVAGKCPDMTRWDGNERRCVFSAQCRRFQANFPQILIVQIPLKIDRNHKKAKGIQNVWKDKQNHRPIAKNTKNALEEIGCKEDAWNMQVTDSRTRVDSVLSPALFSNEIFTHWNDFCRMDSIHSMAKE